MIGQSFIRRGKGMLKRITFCVCLCTMSLQGMAQDDMLTNSSEEPRFKAENFGFNAIDLRQNRFLYADSVEYRNKKFYDNMSVGMAWHFDKIHERIPQGYVPALNYGLFIEKEINKLHSLRLLVYEGVYQQAQRSIRMKKFQGELLHSFNWTRYFGGYNPYRKVEAVTNLGVGAFYSKRLDQVEVGPMFIMGAGARMLLSPAVSLGIEPYVALASDNIDHSGAENFRNYDVLYGTDVSLAYTFHEEKFREELRSRYAGKTFVDFGLGAQFEPYSGYYRQPSSIPFLATAGPHLRLGIGYWLAPGLAIRATGNLSSSNWDNTHLEADAKANQPAYDIRLKNVLANGRLDFLFSPYHYFAGNEAGRFDVNAILGWEYGYMIKTAYNPEDLLRTYYDGFSGGLQFRYNYDKNTSLYIEPRVTVADYNVPYTNNPDYVDHHRDYLFSMTAGLEYAVNEYRFLGRKQQPSKFNPHIAFSLLGGPNYLFVTKEHASDFYVDYSAGLAGEMQITPYSGVRVMADYSQLSYKDTYRYRQQLLSDNTQVSDTALYRGKYGFVNLSADYVFDLGTLLQGYDVNNRWDVALAVGPVYSRRVSQKAVMSKNEKPLEYNGSNPIATTPEVIHRATDHALGVQVGIPVSYRLTPRLELLFEPRARFFPTDYIAQHHSQGATKILNTQLGLRYSINDHYYVSKDSLDEHFKAKPGHLFTHMAVGAQTPQSLVDMGPRVEAGLGYWFNPGIAARATLSLTSHDWRRHSDTFENSLRQMSASGRFDVMLDPFGYLANRYDRPLGFNFIAGWEYGRMLRGDWTRTLSDKYNAFSSGIQLRYNYDSYHALYLEPRYTYNFTAKNSQYSLVAGMELGATEYAFHSNGHQPDEFSPAFSFAMLGGLGYIYNGKEYTDAPVSDYTGGIAAEYKFSPYSGIRMTATYANYHQRGVYSRRNDNSIVENSLLNYGVDYMNFGVDYMFDIATLMQGYTNDRRWNAALAVGPTFGYKVAKSESALRDGYLPSNGGEAYSDEARENLWGVQVGMPVSYSIDDNWAIVFEPRGKASLKHLFSKYTSYPFMQYDALLGMKYTPDEQLYNHLAELNQAHGSRHSFVNYAMGLQYAAGTGMPFGSTGGIQLGLGAGRWMNDLVGVRFGAELATSHLESIQLAEDNRLLKSARIGGRADIMINPLALSNSYTPSRWGTALLLGWEIGGKLDAKYYEVTKELYNSFSVGAQLRYNTDEKHALYLEPRYMIDDRLVSFTAGMEYAMTEHRFRSSKNQPGEFRPYYNIGVGGGASHLFLTSLSEGMPQVGVNAGFSGEYHFTPYSGFRFTLGYTQVANGMENAGGKAMRIGHVNTGFDYMFDLSTLFAGYTPDRRWDVSLAAGPVFSMKISDDESVDQFAESPIGLQVGVPVQYRINSNWGVSLEPRARVYGPDYAASHQHIGGNTSKAVDLQLGMKYTPGEKFYDRMEELNESHDSRYDFVNYAIGLQYATGTGMPFGSTGGIQLGLGAGRWINSLLGVRLGAEMATSHLEKRHIVEGDYDLLLKSARIGARADVMVNPLAMGRSYTPGRWGTALLLGWELGGKIDAKYEEGLDKHFYNSLSVGAQLRYNTGENDVLYLEPRYTIDDRLVSVTAGLEYAMTEHRFRSSKNQPGEFEPYYSVGLAGGVNHLFLPSVYAGMPQLGGHAGMSGEYHFTPYSGFRLTLDYAQVANGMQYGGKALKYSVGHVNAGVDYMFDLSTLFAGYTPDRRWDVSLAAGPVLSRMVSATDEIADKLDVTSMGVQLGIPVQYRINSNWGISLEPRAQMFGQGGLRKYFESYIKPYSTLDDDLAKIVNLQLGVKYTPDEKFYNYVKESDKMSRDYGHNFVNYAMGLQYSSDMVLPFGSTGGVQFGLGAGRWMSSLWGVRLGAEMAASHLEKRHIAEGDYDLLLKSARFGGRADVMFNPLALGRSDVLGRWGTALLLGWELGGKIDAKYEKGLDKHFYNSLSLGAQLRYHTDELHALYIEPRYTFDDRLVSLTAGMEYAMTKHGFRSGKRQPGMFAPYYSVGLAGGVNHLFLPSVHAGMPQLGGLAGLSGEYHFTPYSGLRLTLDYAQIANGMQYGGKALEYSVSHINTGIDYMFDLSTLFAGYTPDRSLDVALAAGPVLSTKVSATDEIDWKLDKTTIGVQLGIPVQYRINSNWGISLEPRAQLFRLGFMDFLEHYAAPYSTVDGDVNRIVNLQAGVKYTPDEKFYGRMEKLDEKYDTRHDFVNYAMGVQYAAGNALPFGSTGGVQLGLGVGRWMNSLVGVRFGAEMAASHLDSRQLTEGELLLKSARFSGRADVMVNPLALSHSYTPGRWGTALLLGWELGAKMDAKYTRVNTYFYNSVSAGAQLRYHTDEQHALYLEPRYAIGDNLVSLTAGMEYAMTKHGFRSGKRQPGMFEPYYSVGLAGGVNHLFLPSVYAGMPQLGGHAGLSGEYHFTPYSGLRLTLDYAQIANGMQYGGKVLKYSVSHINTGIDYMFDLSTLFAGYTPDRSLDVALAAGPVLSTKVSATDEIDWKLDRTTIGVQFGVPVQYRINSNWGISLEPRAQLFRLGFMDFLEHYAAPYSTVDGKLNKIVNLQVGVKYTPGEELYGRMKKLDEKYGTRRGFVNYAMGLQYAAGNALPFGSTGGVQLGLGAGRWMNSLVGVRFGAEMAASHLDSRQLTEGELLLKSARFSGRADVMVNPLALNRSYTPGRLGTALLLGWELGGKIDAKYEKGLDKHFYNSVSVGAQLRYHTDEKHTIYLEPRYTVGDNLVSLTAGMEFTMTENRFRSSKNQPGEFKPYTTVGLAGGVNYLFLTQVYTGASQLDFDMALSGEYHFTPYSGARLTFGYSHLKYGVMRDGKVMNNGAGYFNTGLDYMLDLSTLFAGYTPDRRLDVALAAGPVFSACITADKGYGEQLKKTAVGVQLGIPVQFHLTKKLGVSLEPSARIFGAGYAAPSYIVGGNTSKIINLQMGMKYTF